MGRFSKVFPFLAELFPPQMEPTFPAELSDDVSFVHELLKPDIKLPIYFATQDVSDVGAGADILQTMIAEPPPGFVALPVIGSIFSSAGPQTFFVDIGATGNASEMPTGALWGALSAIFQGQTVNVTDQWVTVPVIVMPRGNFERIRWNAVPAAVTVRSRSLSILVPLETVDWNLAARMNPFSMHHQNQ